MRAARSESKSAATCAAIEVSAIFGDSLVAVQHVARHSEKNRSLWRRKDAHTRGRRFRIGVAPGSDYFAGKENFDLVSQADDGSMMLRVPSNWSAEIREGSRVMPLSEEAGEHGRATLPNDFLAELHCGDHHLVLRSVRAPRRQVKPYLAGIDTRFLAYLFGTTIVTLGLMFALHTHFEEQKSLYGDLFRESNRLSYYRVTAKEKPLLPISFASVNVLGPMGGSGEAMTGISGAMGSKRSERRSGRYAIKDRETDPQLARARALEQAREAGILGVLRKRDSLASLTAIAAFSSGLDSVDQFGGLVGNQVGEMSGAWGYSFTGVEQGGCGCTGGTIGSGHYGTLGHGAGTGSGYSSGSGLGGRGHAAGVPGVRIGNAEATGDLDKNIIRRYIRRKLPRIRHCYEMALLATPGLSGTVDTTFRINPNGKVLAASASGMEQEELHACVAEALSSIQFPAIASKGYVEVRYPFFLAAVE